LRSLDSARAQSDHDPRGRCRQPGGVLALIGINAAGRARLDGAGIVA
jgi:hypothetical protein